MAGSQYGGNYSGSTWEYRVVAQFGAGDPPATYGAYQSVTFPHAPLPTVTTGGAVLGPLGQCGSEGCDQDTETAGWYYYPLTLTSTVTNTGAPALAGFLVGTTTNYFDPGTGATRHYFPFDLLDGKAVGPSGVPGDGVQHTVTSHLLLFLPVVGPLKNKYRVFFTPNTTYHYQSLAYNSPGQPFDIHGQSNGPAGYGANQTFTTGSGPASSSAEVKASLNTALAPAGRTAKIAAILRSGAYSTSLNATSAGVAQIVWYYVPKGAHISRVAKPVVVASGSRTFTKAGKAVLKIRLTPKGRSLLKKAQKIKLTAKGSFTPAGGKKATKLRAITLHR